MLVLRGVKVEHLNKMTSTILKSTGFLQKTEGMALILRLFGHISVERFRTAFRERRVTCHHEKPVFGPVGACHEQTHPNGFEG